MRFGCTGAKSLVHGQTVDENSKDNGWDWIAEIYVNIMQSNP